jgi:hypothetical protein
MYRRRREKRQEEKRQEEKQVSRWIRKDSFP